MYAVLQVPRFALQAVLRHEPPLRTRPVALVDPDTTPPRVVEATPSALEQGVSAGLTAPQALARCRVVSIRARVAAQETAATEALLQCAYGFSPHIESTAPGVITLDLRGLIELRPANGGASAGAEGSEDRALDAWGERLRSAVASLGLDARVGVGPTPNVARHAARWGRGGGGGVEPGVRVVTDPAEFVAGLPVAALEPSTHVVEILQGWGIRTVGELLVLGQASLAERLGLEALGLFAAASVTACRPLKLVKPAERFEETHEFDPGIETLEPLLFLLRRFTESLVRRMEAFGWVVGELRLGLWLESGRMLESRLRVPQPSRRADVLFRMLHTHLEPLRTDSSIVRVGLAAEATRPEQRQFGLFECALRDPNQFQETLARLAALVGADRVGSPVREDSHRPD
ncbi:MAG: DNA polymerase Y family protein, partial [Limisphaerales bacterium]